MEEFLPQLGRLKNPKAIQVDQEIWEPSWACHCCHDTGLVVRPQLIVEDYNTLEDLPVICQNPNCDAGDHFLGQDFDERFTARICANLDAASRVEWKLATKESFEYIRERGKELQEQLAKTKEMAGSRGRGVNHSPGPSAKEWEQMLKDELTAKEKAKEGSW